MSQKNPPPPSKNAVSQTRGTIPTTNAAGAAGAAVVAISATEALAQSTSSDFNCRDVYPWWLCWFLGYKQTQEKNYGGWNGYEQDGGYPDDGKNTIKPW